MKKHTLNARSIAVVMGLLLVATLMMTCSKSSSQTAPPSWLWWEAEKPLATNFPAQNPFAPANEREAAVLSEGRWVGVAGNYGGRTMFLEYAVSVPKAGDYHFYVRKFWKHGPFRWRFDSQAWQEVGRDIALLDEEELRLHIVANWIYAGQVKLSAGQHILRIELTAQDGAAAFDCFLLTPTVWFPKGKLKPGEKVHRTMQGWFVFDPEPDTFAASPIDLRSLNEKFAGEKGFIQVKGDAFVHSKTGEPVRFWGVNAGPDVVRMPQPYVDYLARHLAKLGVNIVRVHGGIWRQEDFRRVDERYLDQLHYFIAAMKREGIYTALSIYFPLWLNLSAQHGFEGYNNQHPFALLFFNKEFQAIYKQWWTRLLTTRNPYTGAPLNEEPAVAFAEIVNEDSYLFWTFTYDRVPPPQMALLEREFAGWLEKKYGALPNALQAWGGRKHPRDDLANRRVGFMGLWEIFNQRDQRAQDTAEFLTRHQTAFFAAMTAFLKNDLKFKGAVYGSNWITANETILGPLDKWSNTVGDFMDRHGYWGGPHKGERASYALSVGDQYDDLCALLQPQENSFALPIMDIGYGGKPSTITEINWTPPNRFRADFPLLCAAYGALQGSDGFCFFALNGADYQRSLTKFAIQTPVVMGQFPALAVMFRKGLVKTSDAVVKMNLKLTDLFALKGAPVRAPMNLDELRAKDIPPGRTLRVEGMNAIDPLAFLVGRVEMNFSEQGGASEIADLSQFINRQTQTVRSATGELRWDYSRGLLTVNAPQAQAASGFLSKAQAIPLNDVTIETDVEYGTIVVVSLDGNPLKTSKKILVQAMTEDTNFGWTAPGQGLRPIQSLGGPPLVVRKLSGTLAFRRPDASACRVTALDPRGYPMKQVGNAAKLALMEDVIYYVVEKS
ncbi:MAG: hypothetical protein NZT92_12505 [Abditibacteriales bacterium]|nr:hypothetical protein [Abditibacteriales bacterium]MDW8366781.1 hypothetical protein [Abditibacteriales bacterium]